MTPFARQTLRTYAEGMGMPYQEVARHWLKLDAVGRGRFLHVARKLEAGWQEEVAIRQTAGFWRRLLARVRRLLRS